MKKYISLLAAALLACSLLAGCTQKSQSNDMAISTELLHVMDEMIHSAAYAKLYSIDDGASPGMNTEVGGAWKRMQQINFTQPQTVYKITLPDNPIQIFEEFADFDIKSLPKSVLPSVKQRFVSTIPSLLNSSQGTSSIILSSYYYASKSVLQKERKTTDIYFFVYPQDAAIAVVFTPANSEIVTAYASLIPVFPVAQIANEKDFSSWLQNITALSITVEKLDFAPAK